MIMMLKGLRASPVVGASQAEIWRYLAPDGCKVWSGRPIFPAASPESLLLKKHECVPSSGAILVRRQPWSNFRPRMFRTNQRLNQTHDPLSPAPYVFILGTTYPAPHRIPPRRPELASTGPSSIASAAPLLFKGMPCCPKAHPQIPSPDRPNIESTGAPGQTRAVQVGGGCQAPHPPIVRSTRCSLRRATTKRTAITAGRTVSNR
jgi:hypothetical protein